MKDVIRGCAVVSDGVVWFVCACGLGFFGWSTGWRFEDLLGVSLWMRGWLFDVSRVCVHPEMAARDIR